MKLDRRTAAYAYNHPASPIAHAWDIAGPVHVSDRLRADIAHAVGPKELARAYGLGVISASSGLAADVHQVETKLWLHLEHPADYLAMWITTACQWSDQVLPACNPDEEEAYEAARLAQIDQYAAELVTCGPVWYVDWLARLVHHPKWVYLVEMGAHAWFDAGTPRDPGTDWSVKMGRQWARRFESAEIVVRVTQQLAEQW